MLDDLELGEILLEKNLMSPAQLQNARNLQKQTGGTLQQLVVKLNYVKPSVLNSIIAEEERVHSVDIDVKNIDRAAMDKIPRKLVDKYCIIALKQDEKSGIKLAMSNPNEYTVVDEISFLTGMKAEATLAPREAILKAINYFYNSDSELEDDDLEIDDDDDFDIPEGVDWEELVEKHSEKELLKGVIELLLDKDIISLQELAQKME